MQPIRLAFIGTAVLLGAGCSDRDGPLDPAATTSAPLAASAPVGAASVGPVETAGHYDAIVDFSTLRLTPRGSNCLLDVDGRLVFTGTIEGTATGHTSALVFATCDEVASRPPGTDRDVFTSRATFEGTVNGEPAHAQLLYQGVTEAGGHIDGRFVFSNGVAGRLEADGTVAVGGEYRGSVVVR